MKYLLTLLISISVVQPVLYGQSRQEKITRTLQWEQTGENTSLILKNITGDVQVTGYQGDVIQIIAQKQVRANNQDDLARGWDEVQLVTDVDGSVARVYLQAPFIETKTNGDDLHYQMNRHDHDDYQFRFDFTVQVPQGTYLQVSTINDGDVRIEGITSERIRTNNINGNIQGTAIRGTVRAQTINGDIDIVYAESPAEESKYKTINGDINLSLPQDLAADVRFESMNGDLFTDFPEVQYLPASVETKQNQSGRKITYRVDKSTQVRIGQGGPLLDFEVLNGSVYLKQN